MQPIKKKKNHATSSKLYRFYYLHRSRELVSPVCGIFCNQKGTQIHNPSGFNLAVVPQLLLFQSTTQPPAAGVVPEPAGQVAAAGEDGGGQARPA